MPSREEFLRRATAAFSAGDHEACRVVGLEGLDSHPGDVELLRLVGRSCLELGREDAVLHLSALVARTPEDPGALLHLGFAHAAGGHAEEAADVFAKVVALTPESGDAALHFAYAAHAAGRTEEAVAALDHAMELSGETMELLRSEVELSLAAGLFATALGAANRLDSLAPKDVGNGLDIAELNLAVGEFSTAADAFARLRGLDVEDGHETFACHGQVEALLRAERWREALDAAISATTLDRNSITTDLLAYVTVKLFGPGGDRPVPDWEELDQRLIAERATHRRLHADRWL